LNVMNLEHKDLTYKLRGGLYQIQNELGLGRAEENYHRAFCHWMSENRISYQSKPMFPITLGGMHVLDLIPDFVVEEKLVIELKAKPCHLTNQDSLQLYHYLKRTGISLGLLCNLGLDRVFIDRHLRTPKLTKYRVSGLGPKSGHTFDLVNEILSQIHAEHQTGYGAAIFDRILFSAFSSKGIPIKQTPSVLSKYKDEPVGTSNLDCMVLNGDTVFCHTCLFDENTFNCSRAMSFMQALSLNHSVAVNFGKSNLEARFFE